MTETQLRFVRAIVERLPLERIVELHLFPPMKQGVVETGIAVVAALREPPAVADAAPDAGALRAGADEQQVLALPLPDAALDAPACDPTEMASAVAPTEPVLAAAAAPEAIEAMGDAAPADTPLDAAGEAAGEAATIDAAYPVPAAPTYDEVPDTLAEDTTPDGTLPPALEPSAIAYLAEETPASEEGATPAAAVPAPRAATGERHTVYTARYRLTLKGPERGKWEAEVVDEADAPLLTVETVVRGVQRRSGEEVEPERLTPDALAELLGGGGSAA